MGKPRSSLTKLVESVNKKKIYLSVLEKNGKQMVNSHEGSIKGLEPRLLWEHFSRISQIPRCSDDEERVRQYVIKVAERNGLLCKIDSAGNISVKKEATEGFAHSPRITLQAHLDMVCEKAQGTFHNFSRDPIQLKRENDGWIRAEGTTLGADNGIGVAASLAILETPDIKHGPLDILFTVNEESGQTGVREISTGMIESSFLVNLDSVEDDALYVGCAGGRTTEISLIPETEPRPEGEISLSIQIKGLLGGHSGLDIHKGRANAIKLLDRFLWNMASKLHVRLASFEGGGKLNAIPREAEAVLVVPAGEVSDVKGAAAEYETMYKEEYEGAEAGIVLAVEEIGLDAPPIIFSEEFQNRLVSLLLSIPHGVIAMSPALRGPVQTSTNLAVVTTKGPKINIGTKQRSLIKSEMAAVSDAVCACGLLAGGEVRSVGDYPAWKPRLDSMILKIACSAYKERVGREPEIKTMHAGLECGILAGKFPGIDMVSVGPRILDAHSPDERVEIASVEKFWAFLSALLGKMADRPAVQ